jgi:hypothetical protein
MPPGYRIEARVRVRVKARVRARVRARARVRVRGRSCHRRHGPGRAVRRRRWER